MQRFYNLLLILAILAGVYQLIPSYRENFKLERLLSAVEKKYGEPIAEGRTDCVVRRISPDTSFYIWNIQCPDVSYRLFQSRFDQRPYTSTPLRPGTTTFETNFEIHSTGAKISYKSFELVNGEAMRFRKCYSGNRGLMDAGDLFLLKNWDDLEFCQPEQSDSGETKIELLTVKVPERLARKWTQVSGETSTTVYSVWIEQDFIPVKPPTTGQREEEITE